MIPKEQTEFSDFIQGLGVRDFFYLRIFHSGTVSDTTYTAQYDKTIHPKTAALHAPTFKRFLDSTESMIKKRTNENAFDGKLRSIPAGRGTVISGTIRLGTDLVHFAIAGVNHQQTRKLADLVREYLIAPQSKA